MSSYRPLAEILDSETPRRMPFRFAPISDDELSPAPANSPKFVLEPWATIDFAGDAEWLVKRLLPRRGVAVLYGKSGTLKSFVASYLAMFIAIGWDVAGRRVTKAPAIYVAAEGSSGLRKRKVGFAKHYSEIPVDVAFSLVAAAPNLGTGTDDLKALIAAMSPARPGLIVLDTLAQSLGAGDENGGGMVQLVANATALANHFDALVLIVHHSGLADDKRMRGHSSLIGAIDAAILCEREEGELSTTLTVQKVKDEEAGFRLLAKLTRVVLGVDEDGDEISTLVVDSIGDVTTIKTAQPKSVPPQQRLLFDVIAEAIAETGKEIQPFADGPVIRAVGESSVRARYYSRIAEMPGHDESPEKLSERQRKAFNRAVLAAVASQRLVAATHHGERFVWLPR